MIHFESNLLLQTSSVNIIHAYDDYLIIVFRSGGMLHQHS